MHFLKTISIYFFIFFIGLNVSLVAKTKPIRILSLDGGGVRGIIGATILDAIESEIGKPSSKIFDLIVGSSIGGITALGLITPDEKNKPLFSALDLVNLYKNNAGRIFSASWLHKLKTAGGLLGPKYDSQGLYDLLDRYVGEKLLSQALTPTVITGYHVDGESGIEFSSVEAQTFAQSKDCLIRDVAMATGAAPIYFDSVDIEFPWGTLYDVVDGGLYKNNPALIAYINAQKLYKGREIDLISIGNGRLSIEELSAQLKGRGLIDWLSPIIKHIQIADSEADNSVLHRLLNEDGKTNFFRLNITIDREHRSLDDAEPSNLEYLYQRGLDATNTKIFKKLITRLKN